MITLGPEQENIRLWLRGEGGFPTDVALNISVSRRGRTLLTLQQPVQVPTSTYLFNISPSLRKELTEPKIRRRVADAKLPPAGK
jgi:hypothetical protein